MNAADQEALLARLEKLEASQEKAKELEQENQILRKQLEQTGSGRRQTEEEATNEKQTLIERNRAPLNPKAKYEWRIHVAPYRKRDTRGKPLRYQRTLRFFSVSNRIEDAVQEYQRFAGTTLILQNSKWESVGFVPPDAQVQEEPEPEEMVYAVN